MRKLLILLFSLIIFGCNSDKDKEVVTIVDKLEIEENKTQVETGKIEIVEGDIIADRMLVGKFDNLDSFLDLYTEEELLSVNAIYLLENKLENMKGIERLKNVTYIDLSKNNISVIEGLATLNKLEYLVIARNQLSDINELLFLKNLLGLNVVGERNTVDEEYFNIAQQVGKNNPKAEFLEF